MTQFLVFGLPRSRTYWAKQFLSLNGHAVLHNQFVHCANIDEIVDFFNEESLSASDPAAGAIWRELLPRIPDVKIALVRRPVSDVLESLRAIGEDAPFLPRLLERYASVLDELEASGLAEVFQFGRLGEQEEAARLFEYCTGERLDAFWWQVMGTRKLQSPEVWSPQERAKDGPIARAMLGFVKEYADAV